MPKKPPQKGAAKPSRRKPPVPISHGWKHFLDCYSNGKPKPTWQNAAIVLRKHPDWDGVLAWDEFGCKISLQKPTPWNYSGTWNDHQELKTAEWLQEIAEISLPPSHTHNALDAASYDRQFHPVRQYLNSLKHDGTSRIEKWLTTYCQVPDSIYTRAIGRKWLISAIARIFHPGCQVDHVLVFQTRQGPGKSSAFRILGVRDEWFTDDVDTLGSKDSKISLNGKWIIELAEFHAVIRSDPATTKAFITRRIECYVPKYGRNTIEQPRQSVLCGSTNEMTPLKDYTGNRRYWFAKPDRFDLKSLQRDRDQLWAEAVMLYRQGIIWWFDEDTEKEIIAIARQEQFARLEQLNWHEQIELWINSKVENFVPQFDGDFFSVSIAEIFEFLQIKPVHQGQREQNSICHSLQIMGLIKFRKRVNGHTLTWRYRLPGDQEETDSPMPPF